MDTMMKIIVFQLNSQQYGIDLQQVLSIERLQNITKLPQTSSFIKGVINLRGEITPIIDLKERLEIGNAQDTESTRVLITQVESTKIGLIVDAATDVVDLDSTTIDPIPTITQNIARKYLKGVAKHKNELLVLLDVNHVLNLEEKKELLKVSEQEI